MSSIDNIKDNILHDDQGSGHSTPTLPIKIPAPKAGDALDSNSQGRSRRRRTRRRAPSEASSYSSQSADSTSPSTPPSARDSSEEETSPVEVATSPLLSYFLANASPTKSAVNFSFKNRRKTVSGSAPLVEDDDQEPNELPPVLHHSRRLSTSWANSGTIGVQQKGPITESQQERNTSLMRRLSLSGGITRPTFPTFPTQPIPVQPEFLVTEARPITPRGPRRSATISTSGRHRPPSPNAERMLKGHFDGF